MPTLIAQPAVVEAACNKPKRIEDVAVCPPAFSPGIVHRDE